MERQVAMFSVMELRLIRYSVKKTIENMKRRLKILDPESDEAVEAKNDLMLYQNIIEKIDDRSDV
jgi:hypothetical protein